MSPAEGGTNWLPGLLMLAAGAVAALAFVFGSKRLKAEPPATGSVDDLTTRYEARLAELRDHRAQKHLIEVGAWATRQRQLELEAAAILRERDGVRHEARKAEGRQQKKETAKANPTSLWAKKPALTGGLIGGAVVGFFMLVGFTLSNAASDRAPGMQATGMQPGGAGPMQPQQDQAQREDPKLAALVRRVDDAPNDPDAVAGLALALLLRQAFDEAKPLADRLAVIDPFHVKGRVARAVLRAVEGDSPGSQDELEHLAAFYPEAYEARLFVGLIAMEENPGRAKVNLEAYASTAPQAEQPPMIRMMIEQLRGANPQVGRPAQ
jgi:hypothetical protein